MEYLPQRRWSSLEKKRAHIMIKAIDKQLKKRRMMRRLENFVVGIEKVAVAQPPITKPMSTMSIEPKGTFVIVFRLDEFVQILRVLCKGVCMYSLEWSISSLPNCVNPNSIYLTPLDDPVVVLDAIFNERPPTKRRKVKGKEVVPDLFQMVLSEMKTGFMKWETILSENAISLSRNKDHPNACLVYMLYCLHNTKMFSTSTTTWTKRMA
ncbi:hypothetical protein Tco_1392380 [Tanacetum coccineum]